MIRLIPGLICVFLGALLYAIPYMTRRGMLFAVSVPCDFRNGPTGRRSVAQFQTLVAIAVLIVLGAVLLSPVEALRAEVVIGQLAIILAATGGFFWQRGKLLPYEIQPVTVREAELSDAPEKLPGFVWLGAGPLAILAGVAAYLNANWDRIPERFPVHWGLNGQPNRWNDRTAHGVYGPLIFAAELCGYMLIMGLASWFGSRRSEMRRVVLGVMLAVSYVTALIFAAIAIDTIVPFSPLVIAIVPIVALAVIVFVSIRKMWQSGEPADPTPAECWKGGVIYYNPADTALFVEKRFGFGYTVNFANRWSWVLMAGLVAIIGSVQLVH